MRQLPGLFPATDGEWTMLFKWRSPDGLHTATHWALLHQVSDLIEIWFTTSRDRVAIQLVGAPIWLGGVPGHIGADGCAIIPRQADNSEKAGIFVMANAAGVGTMCVLYWASRGSRKKESRTHPRSGLMHCKPGKLAKLNRLCRCTFATDAPEAMP